MPLQNWHSCEPQDIGKLPEKTKQIIKYDSDCVPLSEKKFGAQDARDNLTSLWGIQLSPTSPANSSRHSVPATLLCDTIATTTQHTKSPSFFESIYSESH